MVIDDNPIKAGVNLQRSYSASAARSEMRRLISSGVNSQEARQRIANAQPTERLRGRAWSDLYL